MAIKLKELLESVELSFNEMKSIKWGTPVESKEGGIYIITQENKDKTPVFDTKALNLWLENTQYRLTIDDKIISDISVLRERLTKYYLDEEIIYIGKSKSNLNKRLEQFYDHEIGQTKYHAGGQWI